MLVYVIVESWASRPVNGDALIFFAVAGLTLGSIYAVVAQGLVVTYTTSGIFNFAQGAIGALMVFVYWQLKVAWHVPTLPAVLLTVCVVAPVFGVAIERVLMRRIADATLVAQLVVTIGLLLALQGLIVILWSPDESRTIEPFFGSNGFNLGGAFIPYFRLITVLAGIGIAVALRLLLYRTRLGVGMRAVVDNRELAALNGARPSRISMTAWALSSGMAALAGIFLAEELGTLSVQALTLFIVDAFAAAIIARLRSLPAAYAGGMLIGLSIAFQQSFLDWSGRWSQATFGIPTVILFLALLFLPEARIEGTRTIRRMTARVPSLRRAAFGLGVYMLAILICAGMLDRVDVRRVTLAVVSGFLMLSLVPLTGWSGQISLAQLTFAGIGAFAFVQWGNGSLLGLVWAMLFVIPFGVLITLPSLRLQGLYLALATMAFALMAKFLFFEQPEIFGGEGRRVSMVSVLGQKLDEPFQLFGHSFSADAGYLIFVAVIFVLVASFVVVLRRGRFGRRLIAMRDSPAASAMVGINLFVTKLIVFAVASAIAGLAGALLAVHLGTAGTADFEMLGGLPYVLLLVVGGTSVVSGAVLGGFLLRQFTWLTALFPSVSPILWLEKIGPGLAGIGIGRQPDGIIPAVSEEMQAKKASAEKGAAVQGPGTETPAPSRTAVAAARGR